MNMQTIILFSAILAAFGAGIIVGFVICAALGDYDNDKNTELRVRTILAYRAAKAGLYEREAVECAKYGALRLAKGDNHITAISKGKKYIQQRAQMAGA